MRKIYLAVLAAGLLIAGGGGGANAALSDENNWIYANTSEYITVGAIDPVKESTYLENVGESNVIAWLADYLPGDASDYNLYETTNIPLHDFYQVYDEENSSYQLIPDTYAYDLALDTDYFLLKLGMGGLSSTTHNIYLFANSNDKDWAVFNFDAMGITEDYVSVLRVSHVREVIPVSPSPEPATMLLFGVGLAGLVGVVRGKKKD